MANKDTPDPYSMSSIWLSPLHDQAVPLPACTAIFSSSVLLSPHCQSLSPLPPPCQSLSLACVAPCYSVDAARFSLQCVATCALHGTACGVLCRCCLSFLTLWPLMLCVPSAFCANHPFTLLSSPFPINNCTGCW